MNELIIEQRGLVSEMFVLKNQGGAESSSLVILKEYAASEIDLQQKTIALLEKWEESGKVSADDLTLLEIAADQMATSGSCLSGKDLEGGFDEADQSLRTLLKLRKKLLHLISKGKDGEKPCDSDEEKVQFADLISEAERLAREEADVNLQLNVVKSLEIIQRQQEVAVADAGELYSKLVAHPDKTDGAMRLMDEAEKAMIEAESLLHTNRPMDAKESLTLAEERLYEFADFIRALDEENLSETLKQLAEEAKENSEELAKESKPKSGQAEGEGEKPGSSESEEVAEAQTGEESPKEEETGKSSSEKLAQTGKAGKKSGQGQSGVGQSKLSVAAEEAAADAAKVDEILKSLAKRGEGGGESEKEAEKGEGAGKKNELEKFRESLAAAGLSEALAKLSEKSGSGKEGEAKSQEEAERLSEALSTMAQQLQGYAKNMDRSKLAKLAEAKKEVENLKRNLEESFSENAPGNDPFANQFSSVNALPDSDAKQPEIMKTSGASRVMKRLILAATALKNDKLNGMVRDLNEMRYDSQAIVHVKALEKVIDKLILELPQRSKEPLVKGEVSSKRRREIEDYYRSLSDDFGGEVWKKAN